MAVSQKARPAAFHLAMLVLSALIVLPILDGYLFDLLGLPLEASAIGVALAVQTGVGLLILRWRRQPLGAVEPARLIGGLVVLLVALGIGLFIGWPTFLPASSSVDAIHHYSLIDYIYRHHHLVHDRAEVANLGEMIGYPFAACLLVALLAQALGQPPLLLLEPTAAIVFALLALFVYALVTELTERTTWHQVTAAALELLLFLWPASYVVGQFTRDFYLTQMGGTVCLLGLWYWLVVYLDSARSPEPKQELLPEAPPASHQDGALALAALIGLGLGALFSYPTLLPSFALAFVLAPLLGRPWPSWRRWLRDGAIVAAPLVVLGTLYLHDRVGIGMAIIRSNGQTISPSFDTLPPLYLALVIEGLLFAATQPRLRVGTALVWATLLQTAAFYGAVWFFRELSPYAAKKMFFVLVPELTVVATLALLADVRWLTQALGARSRTVTVTVPLVAGLVVGLLARPVWLREFNGYDPRSPSREPLTTDDVAVVAWIQANLSERDLIYFVDNPLTADWIDVGLLRSPREAHASHYVAATADEYVNWVLTADLPARAVVADHFDEVVGPEVEVLFRSGDAGVIARRETATTFDPTMDRIFPPTTLGDVFALRRAILDKPTYAPGETLLATTIVQATTWPRRHYILEVRLRDVQGQIVSRVADPLTPLDRLIDIRAGQAVVKRLALPIPLATPSGWYNLELVFFDDYWGTLPIRQGQGPPSNSIVLNSVVVATPADLPPANAQPTEAIGARLGDKLELIGLDSLTTRDGTLALDLDWRALHPLAENYTFFVQLLNQQGRPVAQVDTYPWSGRYPTSVWKPDVVVRDHYRLALPANLAPGPYRLIAGAYRLETMQRLPVADASGQPRGDFVAVGTLTFPRS